MGSASSSHLQNLEISPKAVYETLEYDLYDAHDGYRKLSLFHFKINSDPELIDFSVSDTLLLLLIVLQCFQCAFFSAVVVPTSGMEVCPSPAHRSVPG